MGQPIPAQHPSVVLRSHFNLVRTLLIIAMVALLASAGAVVILANDDDQVSSATKATPHGRVQPQLPAGTRFDGGPEEGTRGARSYYDSPTQRSSYQPAPADGFKDRAGGPTMMPQGPGAR
jgi:hypothetical protein